MPVEVVFTTKIRVKCLGISTGRRLIALSKRDAERLGFKVHDRVEVRASDRSATAIIVTSQKLVSPGEAAVSEELAEDLGLKDGDEVVLRLAGLPESLMYIRKKMRGQRLSRREIYEIVKDVVEHHLTELEIAAFLLAEEFHGMSMEEIEYLTRAMAETGQIVDFDRPVYDKHSIGGVPGNKVSLLIVPIVAASGLLIPKTSSKAITSPSGTANTMSMLAPVEFTAEELKEIALKAGGCIVWGGKLNIAPADDIFIEVEHPLGVDPTSQMLASIMSKKLAVGVDNLVIDIPVGRGTKAETISEGRRLAQMFVDLGKRVGIR
ncbi:MAG TPA: thymidine phosphorylase, partial [Candidatus Bathyarchaeota archaeon]|nr:thymidine phosphorylase [Candidatus Bathyarchaeota archaeon]